MKNMILIITLFFPWWLMGQQLPANTLFSETNFIWNPAMTAVWDYMEFGATYQKQWTDFKQAPETARAFIQIPVYKCNMSFGGSLMRDQVGLFEQNMAAITYAYRIRPGLKYNDQLSIGIGLHLFQMELNSQDAVARDGGDPAVLGTTLAAINPNISLGVFYASKSGRNHRENFAFGGLALSQSIPVEVTLANGLDQQPFNRAIHGNAIFGARFHHDYTYWEPAIMMDYSAMNIFHATARVAVDINEVFWGAIGYSTDQTVHFNGGVTIKGGFLRDGALRIGGIGKTKLSQVQQDFGLGFEFYVAYRFYFNNVLDH